jgi:ABC-type transporter Mla subunit MlaD
MADDSGGGSGFMGVIIGALLVAVLVVGFIAYNGGFGGGDTASIKVEAPEDPSPG